ncbi:hypothetical protein J6590_099771, partial [Homalodisca vitripennis]
SFVSFHSGGGQQKRCVIGIDDRPGRLSTCRKIVDKVQIGSRMEPWGTPLDVGSSGELYYYRNPHSSTVDTLT